MNESDSRPVPNVVVAIDGDESAPEKSIDESLVKLLGVPTAGDNAFKKSKSNADASRTAPSSAVEIVI